MIIKKGDWYEWRFTVDRRVIGLAYRVRTALSHRFLGYVKYMAFAWHTRCNNRIADYLRHGNER